MIPKVRRKDKARGAVSTRHPAALADASSSAPHGDPSLGGPGWGGGPQPDAPGAPHEEAGPRSSRRRSRRLRDRSPPDYSADEIISLVTSHTHSSHSNQQQQQQQLLQQQQEGKQQRQKKRGAPRSLSSSKPSARRTRREESRGPPPVDGSWGQFSLSSSRKHDGAPAMVDGGPHPGGSVASSSSLRALAVDAATAATSASTEDACVVLPLNQARALLASASPAAVHLAAAAAAAANPLDHKAVPEGLSAPGGGGPWGPPRLDPLVPDIPAIHSPHPEALGLRPPHNSTHPYRYADRDSLATFIY